MAFMSPLRKKSSLILTAYKIMTNKPDDEPACAAAAMASRPSKVPLFASWSMSSEMGWPSMKCWRLFQECSMASDERRRMSWRME